MRLYFQETVESVSKQLAPCYLVFGDQVCLTQEVAKIILDAAQVKGYKDVIRFYVERDFDWNQVMHVCQTLNLFGTGQLICLTFFDKPDVQQTKALSNLAQCLSLEKILLITGPRLTQAQMQAKWFTALENQGVFIATNHPQGQAFRRWMQACFDQVDLQITADALAWMCMAFEGNLSTALDEIKKLQLTCNSRCIDTEILKNHITAWRHFSVFHWIEALLNGEKKRALLILHTLYQDELEPQLLAWSIAKEMNLIAQFKQLKSQGQSIQQISQNLKIWQSHCQTLQQVTKHLSIEQYDAVWQVLKHIDQALATFDKEKAWLLLEQLSLTFFHRITIPLEPC